MAVGGGGASVARAKPVDAAPLGAIARVPRARQLSQVGRVAGSGLGRTMAGGCFRCGLVGHWKNECPRAGRVDNRSCFTCGKRGHVSRDCARRVTATDAPLGVGKGKDRAEHGPAERRMGPNEKGWLEAKNTFFDDEGAEDDGGDREVGRPLGCAFLDGGLERGIYECWEGLCGDACVSGKLCTEGSGNLFCWRMLGGAGW